MIVRGVVSQADDWMVRSVLLSPFYGKTNDINLALLAFNALKLQRTILRSGCGGLGVRQLGKLRRRPCRKSGS